MYKIENQDRYREVIYSGGALNSASMTINGNEVPTSQIKSIKFYSPIIDTTQDYFYIGTFNAQKAEIQFKNADNIDLTGTVDITISTMVDGVKTEIPMGEYLIDTSPENYFQSAKITCYDYSILFKDNVDIRQFMNEETNLVTAEDLLKGLVGLFLGSDRLGTYPEINRDATTGFYDNTKSGKYYISHIAEIMGGNAKIGRDGKLYIIPLKRVPEVSINVKKSKSWTLSERYKISRVFYEDANARKYDNGETTDNSLNIRTSNIFMTGDNENCQRLIDNLGEALKGFEMYAIKTENYGEPTLDCWDLIDYQVDGVSYPAFYDNTLIYEQNIMATVETKIPSKQKQEVTNVIKDDDVWKNTIEQEVNSALGEIKTTITRVQQISDEFGNSYSKEQINKLIQDAISGLTNIFSISGGNNLLTNTVPYRIISDTKLENWEGNIGSINENSSINGKALLLKSGTVSQSVELPPNTYAIGFKWKRLIRGATLTISYNGREILINENDEVTSNNLENFTSLNNEITSYGQVTSDTFRIEFTTEVNNAFEIYELRLVNGSVAVPWTQNQNEMKTKTVNIGDGITISSDNANTINKLDADGMRVKNATSKEDVLVANDDGIETKNLTSKGVSNVSGLLIQRIDGHVYITGLKN